MPTNSNSLILSVVMGDGRKANITVNPYELLFDNNGLILTFTMIYDDGTRGHFILLPDDKTVDAAFTITEKILVPLGIELSAGELLDNSSTIVNSLANFGQNYMIIPYVQRIVRDFNQDNFYSYYAVDNGERVFRGAIRLNV